MSGRTISAFPTTRGWRASGKAPPRSRRWKSSWSRSPPTPASPAGAMPLPMSARERTRTAVEEMIAPQARGPEVPDAAGIPAFMEQIQRNLHLFGRYGITMFAISALDIALWDLAAKAKGVPLHRLIGEAQARADSRLCEPAADRQSRPDRARMRDRAAAGLQGDQAARDHDACGICRAAGDRPRHSADGRHELSAEWRGGDRLRAFLPRRGADVPRGAGLAAGRFCDARRSAQPRAGSTLRPARTPARCISSGR